MSFQNSKPTGEKTPSVVSLFPPKSLSAAKTSDILSAGSLLSLPAEPASSTDASPAGKEEKNIQTLPTAKPRVKRAVKRSNSRKKGVSVISKVAYQPEFCERLLAFFDVQPFTVTEVQKKDGSISLLESASELPTFAAFARTLGVTQMDLRVWEETYPAFAEAAKKARDLQGDILIQNSLRGNYSSSFAVFTAKNLLGWSDGKEENKKPLGTVIVRWEKE